MGKECSAAQEGRERGIHGYCAAFRRVWQSGIGDRGNSHFIDIVGIGRGGHCVMLDEVSSSRHQGGTTLALSRTRHEASEDSADIIDLVHLPRGTRPTPIAYLDFEEVERLRIMECEHYHNCLTFAAEVKWRSFHCRQCPENPERAGQDDGSGPRPARAATILKLR